MKTKLAALFLSECALLSLGFVACKDSSTEGLAYFPLPDGTYAVAQGSTQYLEEIIIPEKHKGKKVTAIAENAFKDAKLQSITIPDGITSIDKYAFSNCDNLTSVYYKGTTSEWTNITIESPNPYLTTGTRYYYSEAQPSETGNYWHYVDGIPTVWD